MKSEKEFIPVEIPTDLLGHIDRIAEKFGESRETVINRCIRAALPGVIAFSQATTPALSENSRLYKVMHECLGDTNISEED